MYYLWPLSPLLGFNYLYPICFDMEYRKGINDGIKIRFYITILHELIRSGGSLILQSYSLIEGTDIENYIIITSIVLNCILFVKCKLIIIYWLYNMIEKLNMNKLRKNLQVLLILFEPICIISTLLAMARFSKIWGMIAYAIILVYNVLYTTRITKDSERNIREDDDGQKIKKIIIKELNHEQIMKDY